MSKRTKTLTVFGIKVFTHTNEFEDDPKEPEPEGPVKGNSSSNPMGFSNLAFDRYDENYIGPMK